MTAPQTPAQTPNAADLIGSWSLDSFVETNLTTHAKDEPFGPTPQGYISFGADGRILVAIVRSGRAAPANLKHVSEEEKSRLYETLMAYGGTYENAGAGRIVFHIDISWNEAWTGQAQDRYVEISGDRLFITVGPQIGIYGQPIKAVLSWTRVPASLAKEP